MSKAILSFPYSGAIQYFFATKLVSPTFGENHNYYKTIWGSNYESIQKIALTLFTLYDEVIFSPVDNPLPEFQKYWLKDEYYNPELGLRMPSRVQSLGFDYDEHHQYVDWCLEDSIIQSLLHKIPDRAKKLILSQVVCDIELSFFHGAEVISTSGRRALMNRICKIDPQYTNAQGQFKNISKSKFLTTEILIPDFEIDSVDLLYKIKTDKETRKYSRSVTNLLHSPSVNGSEQDFINLALESNIVNGECEELNNFFSISSKIFSVLGFIPVIGPILSGVSLGLGEMNRITNFSNSNWLEFKPHITSIKTKRDIEYMLKNLTKT